MKAFDNGNKSVAWFWVLPIFVISILFSIIGWIASTPSISPYWIWPLYVLGWASLYPCFKYCLKKHPTATWIVTLILLAATTVLMIIVFHQLIVNPNAR